MEKECAKFIMKNAGVNEFVLTHLLTFITLESAKSMCHPCSLHLLFRSSREMILASYEKQWDICGSKLLSLVMLLGFGFLDVFKENLKIDLESGQVVCNEVDYDRFSQCCIKKNKK